MSRRISLSLTLLGVMLIAALLPAASFADPANPPPPAISYPSTGLNPPASLAGANGRLAVMIELAAPAVIAAPNGPNSRSAHQQITAAQAALMPQLASLERAGAVPNQPGVRWCRGHNPSRSAGSVARTARRCTGSGDLPPSCLPTAFRARRPAHCRRWPQSPPQPGKACALA